MAIPVNVQNAIDNGYEFRFGDYVSKGFQIVQKNVGQFIVGALVIIVILFGASMISTAISGVLVFFAGVAAIIFSQLVSQFIQTGVLAPLSAGLYHAAHKTDTNKAVEFSDFFAGFNKFTPLFTTTIMMSVLVLISTIPGIYLMYQGGLDISILSTPGGIESLEDVDWSNVSLGILVAMIPAIFLSVSYMYAPLLTWFYDVSGWEALEASRKLVGRNFFGNFALMFVMAIIAGLGILLICVGILFTFPVYTSSIYAAFADAVGLNRHSENASDEVIDHFAPKM